MPFRLLLDGNFPQPPGFNISDIDATVEALHIVDFDRTLTRRGTPDWYIYLRAAHARFDAVVTRDQNQTTLAEEMWVLSKLRLSLITFRRSIEDPIVEWGQLLAYLPEVRKRIAGAKGGTIILLPRPELGARNQLSATNVLHQMASEQGRSGPEIQHEAEANVMEYLSVGDLRARYGKPLEKRVRKKPARG